MLVNEHGEHVPLDPRITGHAWVGVLEEVDGGKVLRRYAKVAPADSDDDLKRLARGLVEKVEEITGSCSWPEATPGQP